MAVNPELVHTVFPPLPPYQVGREKVREFARAVFCDSPLSLDVDAARSAGYPDLVAPVTFPVVLQQHTLEMLLADPRAGIDFSRVVHGDQRFDYTRPMVAGDEVTTTLRVVKVQSLGGHSMVTSESEMRDAHGELICVATSTLVVRGEES